MTATDETIATPSAEALDEILATPEGEAQAVEHAALLSCLDRCDAYRDAALSRNYSPTAAECFVIDRHRLLFANIERAAALQHETQLALIRLLASAAVK